MTAFSVLSGGVFVPRGARAFAALFVLGLVSGLAFPPFHFWPFLLISFPLFGLFLERAMTKSQAFACGWTFAFGLQVACLHWIAGALFVDIEQFWWALPLAVFGLPAVFALYYGFAAVAAQYLRGFFGGVPAVLAVCWFAAEMARAHFFTGLPWNLLGYVWSDFLPLMQSVSVFGIEGLTLATIFFAFAPLFLRRREGRLFILLVAAGAVFLMIWGGARLAQAPSSFVEGVRLRLVQPGQDQADKWREVSRLDNFRRLLDLSFSPAETVPTHILWPETAAAYYLAELPEARARIAARMPQGAHLLTGIVRRQPDAEGKTLHYNSLVALNERGDIVAGYDKHHLVPFGEYVPFRAVIPIKAVAGLGFDFSKGDGPRSLRVSGLPPFSPLICYEAIFSGEVADRNDPPHFLLNVTNDAWYEGTIGPAQHFAVARARAIEEGLPLVRVANKGFTAIVDPFGRIGAHLSGDKAGIVDGNLPKPLSRKTIFVAYGRATLWLSVLTLFALAKGSRKFAGKRENINSRIYF